MFRSRGLTLILFLFTNLSEDALTLWGEIIHRSIVVVNYVDLNLIRSSLSVSIQNTIKFKYIQGDPGQNIWGQNKKVQNQYWKPYFRTKFAHFVHFASWVTGTCFPWDFFSSTALLILFSLSGKVMFLSKISFSWEERSIWCSGGKGLISFFELHSDINDSSCFHVQISRCSLDTC